MQGAVQVQHFIDIFIERLWRTLKYELIYLKAYETGVMPSILPAITADRNMGIDLKRIAHRWFSTFRAGDFFSPEEIRNDPSR